MTYLERALRQIGAVMHQPPVLPRMPCDRCGSYMDVTAEQDERPDSQTGHYAVRYLCRDCDVDEYAERLGDRPTVVEHEHTNGPAANGAAVTQNKEEERDA